MAAAQAKQRLGCPLQTTRPEKYWRLLEIPLKKSASRQPAHDRSPGEDRSPGFIEVKASRTPQTFECAKTELKGEADFEVLKLGFNLTDDLYGVEVVEIGRNAPQTALAKGDIIIRLDEQTERSFPAGGAMRKRLKTFFGEANSISCGSGTSCDNSGLVANKDKELRT